MPTMDLKQLFTDDRAVSPVIGTILLVSLTLLLVASLTTFIMDEGRDRAGDEPPSANFEFSHDGANRLTITHMGGGEITEGNTGMADPCSARSLQIWRDGEVIDCWGINPSGVPAGIGGGDKFVVGHDGDQSVIDAGRIDQVEQGESIKLVWISPAGEDSSQVLGSFET